ncbi:uncharacterized protein [Macrobrachium rosenbergii]|uniref:uncharacterized protein n=1 Tax=Macrobrachium rosenbergii TaxID=79674 RepID=UPI0034D56E3F
MDHPEERLSTRKKLSVRLLILLVILNGYPSSAFVFKTGECRSISETVKNFDIGQFLGTWYVIQSSNTAARCHSISIKDKSGSFAFTVNKQLYSLLAAGIVHNLHYEAQVYPNPQKPASMVVRMPSSLYSDISYEVIGTDYKTWAVVWACKNQMFGHLESGMILSRTTTLPIESLTLIRQDLMSLGVSKLSTVQQRDCSPKLGGGFFTLELASGLTNVPVDWQTLIPNTQVPSAITAGCFVQEGQYFYFREVCPSASTGSNPGSTNSSGDYYYYYYDDPAALVGAWMELITALAVVIVERLLLTEREQEITITTTKMQEVVVIIITQTALMETAMNIMTIRLLEMGREVATTLRTTITMTTNILVTITTLMITVVIIITTMSMQRRGCK